MLFCLGSSGGGEAGGEPAGGADVPDAAGVPLGPDGGGDPVDVGVVEVSVVVLGF